MSAPAIVDKIAALLEEAQRNPERRPAIYDQLDELIFREIFHSEREPKS
jgi:hypothetical protein